MEENTTNVMNIFPKGQSCTDYNTNVVLQCMSMCL